MLKIRDRIQEQTLLDLNRNLVLYGKCALIRCMGFGKTMMMAKMAAKYERVLFLYPSKYSKEEIERVAGDNITYMTYMKLVRLNQEEIKGLPSYDLICLDECHRCGAENTRDRVRLLMEHQSAHFIGATGTPDRMDSFDVVKEFFDGISVYEYTLHDAFVDGIVKRPYYCFCTYDLETDLKEAALTAGEDPDDPRVKEVIAAKVIEWAGIFDMPSVIRSTIKGYVKKKSYMKFIVFFSTFNQLHEMSPDVVWWFEQAFEKYTVSRTIVTSEREYYDNLDLLGEMAPKRNTIDLIMCVDMLNTSAHLKDLTGIVMYRGTSSSIVYLQQLGRVLSAGQKHPGIVFDIVDNLHRKALVTIAEEHRERQGEWWHHANDIEPEDMIATGHEATYRELIAKAVAEPIAIRCRTVYEEHRRLWSRFNNEPYPSTSEELLSKSSHLPPLTKIAKWQGVTVEMVMEYVFPEVV